MFRYVVLAIALAQLSCVSATEEAIQEIEDPGADMELVLAYVLNRHGERTPDEDELSLSNEKEKLQEFIDINGFEGLTNIGKRRVYYLGKFLRERYGPEGFKLLSNIYYKKEIALRSTDKERTKMTAMIAMSALYPPAPEQQWNDDLGKYWQPVPYTAVPLSEDYLRFYSNCDAYKTLMSKAKAESIYEEFAPFTDLIYLIKENTGRNFTENPTMFQTLFDLFRSQTALGLSIPDWATPIMPRLQEAARLAYRLYFRTEMMKKLGGGIILNDFVKDAAAIAAGETVNKRFHMYSSHDFNLGAMMEVTKVAEREQLMPEYGSLFGLEMYKNKKSGKFTILPLYLPHADETNAYELLHFKACPFLNYCDLDTFLASTQDYLMTEQQFYSTCPIKTELGY